MLSQKHRTTSKKEKQLLKETGSAPTKSLSKSDKKESWSFSELEERTCLRTLGRPGVRCFPDACGEPTIS